MNIQAANQDSNHLYMPRPQRSQNIGKWIEILGYSAIIIAFIVGVIATNIYLNQRTEMTEREISNAKRTLANTERELKQLRIQREQLMAWPHIKTMIAHYGIKLHGPNPGQVAKMSILTPEQASRIPLEVASTNPATITMAQN